MIKKLFAPLLALPLLLACQSDETIQYGTQKGQNVYEFLQENSVALSRSDLEAVCMDVAELVRDGQFTEQDFGLLIDNVVANLPVETPQQIAATIYGSVGAICPQFAVYF